MKKLKILILLMCLIVPISFSACKSKSKPTLSTPTVTSINSGIIVFNSIKNAEYYTISINDNELTVNAKQNNYAEIVGNEIRYDASKIFIVGNTYSVKIKANSSKAHASSFSDVYTYKHSGNVKTPTNVKINATTLTWNVVENASYYLVKIITPNDKIIFDKTGNVLTGDTSETIKIADLPEYSFNSNQFDFGSLLTDPGNYKFYVSAVLSDETTLIESSFTEKTTYTHTIKLSSPRNGQVYNVNNELHLVTAIDKNANAISISCANLERTVEINSSESIEMFSDNLANVNLTKFFEPFILNGQLNFDNISQYSFKTQSRFVTTSTEGAFYIDSDLSSAILFENTEVLSAPALTIDYSETNSCYVANWTPVNPNLIGEFKVLVFTQNGLKEYKLDSNITSMLLTEDFLAVAIKSVGVGNYLSSKISEIVSNPTISNKVADITVEGSDSGLTWTEIENAYYFVECGTSYYVLDTNNFEIPIETLSSNNQTVIVSAFVEGLQPRIKSVDLNYTKQLNTPTFSSTQGFSSKKLYELTFTGTDNAIGYYVYVKSKDASDYVKINTIYTTTTIDLSQYIISEGEYTDYSVKVQAVADIHSVYSDSQLSEALSVSHIKILPKPEFYNINGTITPVSKQISNGETKYVLKFYGIQDAGGYEILINYNKHTVTANSDDAMGLYEIDISKYLTSANNYEIQIRSLPKETSFNVAASEYNVANYALMKQLPGVENIQVIENEGIFTLSFKPVDNAERYRVRIVKENDSDYIDYLDNMGLKNYFEITESVDVSEYLSQQGVYYFYITALAPKEDSYYADANESATYARLEKLNSLKSPTNIIFENISKDEYSMRWIGDENADYYLIRLKDPNNITYEFKVYGETGTNINDYITIQGNYEISIYSMVETVGGNSKEFASSSATSVTERYIFTQERDFLRYSVYMYGNNHDFSIGSAEELKNILWYHYLYDIDINTGLSLLIERHFVEDENAIKQETLREAIIRIATEANNSKTYNFNKDETWLNLVKEATTSDNDLFKHVCMKLISAYPEFNILSNFSLNHSTGNDIFQLYYKNALNVEKIDNDNSLMRVQTNLNYGNDFEYVDLYLRKSESGVFKIDSNQEMLVTTTEQLLQAVQHGRKPKFVGDSSVAETVYNNAKLVLSAIVTNNMTDLDKVTAIFDWLEYSFDLTYYSNANNKYFVSGSVESSNIATYGMYKHYYLEGIFENISMQPNGDLIIGSSFATSQSYSKAFALLCAIEGIEAVVVNGNYSYLDTTMSPTGVQTTVDHAWNKVYLSTTSDQTAKHWYVVDLTFSDNRIYFNSLNNGYGISSHTYFLTLDSVVPTGAPNELTFTDENHIISSEYLTSRKTPEDSQYAYNYYANSTFSMTSEQIAQTITNYKNENEPIENYAIENYLKEFRADNTYQLYSQSGLEPNSMQSYLLNALIYAEYKTDTNESGRSVFEFRYNWSNHTENFNYALISGLLETYANKYQLGLTLKFDPQSNYAIYSIKNNSMQTTTVVFIVEKSV